MLGDMISRLSISYVYLTTKQLNKMQVHNGSLETNSSVTSLLTSVTTLCKALGQSAKALKERCKKLYVLSNCFGPPSAFFTITPDDVCILCVHMYANQGNTNKLPTHDCTDSDCIQDFELQYQKKNLIPWSIVEWFPCCHVSCL